MFGNLSRVRLEKPFDSFVLQSHADPHSAGPKTLCGMTDPCIYTK